MKTIYDIEKTANIGFLSNLNFLRQKAVSFYSSFIFIKEKRYRYLIFKSGEPFVVAIELYRKIGYEIKPLINGSILVVAHNALFDMSVLKCCLRDYGIARKTHIPYLCTVQIGRRVLPKMSHKLNSLCDYYSIELDHHHAGRDSLACTEILL